MQVWREFKERCALRQKLYDEALLVSKQLTDMLEDPSIIYVGYVQDPRDLVRKKQEFDDIVSKYFKECDKANLLDVFLDPHNVPRQTRHLRLVRNRLHQMEEIRKKFA